MKKSISSLKNTKPDVKNPQSYRRRFVAVANLGAEADYSNERPYIVEFDLTFGVDSETELDTIWAAVCIIRNEFRRQFKELDGILFEQLDDMLVWQLADAGEPELFITGQFWELRNMRPLISKTAARNILRQVNPLLPQSKMDLLIRVEADFPVVMTGHVTLEKAKDLVCHQLKKVFEGFEATAIVETFREGDRIHGARGEGWMRIHHGFNFPICEDMSAEQIYTVSESLNRKIGAGESEVTDIWLLENGTPVLNLELLLQLKLGVLDKPEFDRLQTEQISKKQDSAIPQKTVVSQGSASNGLRIYRG